MVNMDLGERSALAYTFILVITFAVCSVPVCSIQVSAPKQLSAVKGDSVTLSCSFSSSSRPTSRLSVSWTYRPQSGGPAHAFFHFSSSAYPPEEGPFKGRVKWLGSPSRGDASILLLNASLSDNGTFSCAVTNPPDVHGEPALTTLTVTPPRYRVRFTDVAALLVLILVPSGFISLVLLVRMLCPCCSHTHPAASATHHSPIEVTDGEELNFHKPSPKHKSPSCCQLYLLDDDDEYYLDYEKRPAVAESQC